MEWKRRSGRDAFGGDGTVMALEGGPLTSDGAVMVF